MDLFLHLTILLDKALHILDGHRCFLQLLVFLLEAHKLGMDVIRTETLPLQIKQFLEVHDLK